MLKDESCSILADHRRLDLGGRLHARLRATWSSTTWSTPSSPPAPPSSTWISSRRSASSTTRRHASSPTTTTLRELYIDRIYDTYIDEEELQACDSPIGEIANELEPRPYSSREFIREMGKLAEPTATPRSRSRSIQLAYREGRADLLPGLHRLLGRLRPGQAPGRAPKADKPYLTIDAVARLPRTDRDQDRGRHHRPLHGRRRRAEELRAGHRRLRRDPRPVDVEMHKYAVQITVADVRDGACSVLDAEGGLRAGARCDTRTSRWCSPKRPRSLPLIVSDAYHRGDWKKRKPRAFSKMFK